MLSIHLRLGLPSGPFPSEFPTNKLYTFLFEFNAHTFILIRKLLEIEVCSFTVTAVRQCTLGERRVVVPVLN
jgi:hypothetical protein